MDSTQHPASVPERVAEALALHRAGRVRDAEAIYRAVLAADPRNADALHFLGVIALQQGDPSAAASLIERACAERPGAPDMLNNLGEAYRAASRPRDAEGALRRALARDPHYADALNNLGNILQGGERADEAEDCYRRALAARPQFAEAHNNLGALLRKLGRLADAETHFRLAISSRPKYVEAYRNLALVLEEQGRADEAARVANQARALDATRSARHPAAHSARAEAAKLRRIARECRDALSRNPSAPAHHALARVLARLGDLSSAEREYRNALALDPSFADARAGLADTLRHGGRLDEAEHHYRSALQARPDAAEACNNLANLLAQGGQAPEAEYFYRRTIVLRPDLPEAHHNLASLLVREGRLAEARVHYRRALELAPGDAPVSWNYSLLCLHLGDLAEGFRLYESRFEAADEKALGAARRVLRRLEGTSRWRGESLEGKTLLVWTEQGLGDSVMFARFLPELKRRGVARLLVYCEPVLVRLMRSITAVDDVVSRAAPVPTGRFDLHCPVMSLAHLLGTTGESIPRDVPYLHVPQPAQLAWRARLAGAPRPRVGIAWKSGSLSTAGAARDVPLACLQPLFAVRGVSFVSLQKGQEAARTLSTSGYPVADPMRDAEDLMDTAALMQELDLIVSVDTVVPHLAGALGRPVWLLNRYESDWRWMPGRTSSAWYPGMTLFTQPDAGNWRAVIMALAAELERWARRWSPREA